MREPVRGCDLACSPQHPETPVPLPSPALLPCLPPPCPPVGPSHDDAVRLRVVLEQVTGNAVDLRGKAGKYGRLIGNDLWQQATHLTLQSARSRLECKTQPDHPHANRQGHNPAANGSGTMHVQPFVPCMPLSHTHAMPYKRQRDVHMP